MKFALLVSLFYLASCSSYSGETDGTYWGFNANEGPVDAAERSFKSGDNRFLALRLTHWLGGKSDHFFGVKRCDNHPLGADRAFRFNDQRIVVHFSNDVEATQFAIDYNVWLETLMYLESEFHCEPVRVI